MIIVIMIMIDSSKNNNDNHDITNILYELYYEYN